MRSGPWGLRVAGIAMVVALAACQGTGSMVGGSPAGIPVKVESIDGVPASMKSAFANALMAAASDRRVEIVGSAREARYRVRGYLTTETTEDGSTALAYVWDVFDSQKRRAKRLAGSSPAPATSVSDLDKAALAKLAQASMDEIAEFLTAAKSETPSETSATPEAPIQTAEVSGDESSIAMQ